jgi:hypothetical protein
MMSSSNMSALQASAAQAVADLKRQHPERMAGDNEALARQLQASAEGLP